MAHPEYLKELTKAHFWVLIDILKAKKHQPSKFNPYEKGNFEVFFCAFMLQFLEQNAIDKCSLGHIAYVTYLLGKVMTFPDKDYSEDMVLALQEYTAIGRKEGFCDKDGSFLTKRILPIKLSQEHRFTQK